MLVGSDSASLNAKKNNSASIKTVQDVESLIKAIL